MCTRPVEYWIEKDVLKKGIFHTWGKRQDQWNTEFFGIVEEESGQCIELDPIQIRFLSN